MTPELTKYLKMKMNNLGYYYSKELKTVLIGYRDQNGRLVGKVIGHTIQSPWGHAFSIGYTYDSWQDGFYFVCKLSSFSGYQNYLSFLNPASNKQIEGYFAIKNVVLRRHGSRIKKKKIDGQTYKYIVPKAA